LRPILADPAADGPRLAYADWLDETGDADRAEFIRVQCALAALPVDEREYHPLRQREAELLEQHRAEWVRPVRSLVRPEEEPARGWRRWFRRPPSDEEWFADFRRGFVEILDIESETYIERAADLAAIT